MYLAKRILSALLVVLSVSLAHAQDWQVNPGDYQYSMSIVAFLNVDGETLTSEDDKVAAFAGDQVRGVGNPILVQSANRYLVYLTVFANKEGEDLTFKIFDSGKNKVVDVSSTLEFRIDEQHGNAFQAFSIAHPLLNSHAEIEDFYFSNADTVETEIGAGTVKAIVEYDQDRSALAPAYNLSTGARMYFGEVQQTPGADIHDFSAPLTFQVLSEDESTLNTYIVTVENRVTSEDGFVCTNVVTANNDGANDTWIVVDVFKYKDHEFRILDANGRTLFESVGYDNEWDAFYKGSKLERGKYYYVIKNPRTNKVIQGHILVLH